MTYAVHDRLPPLNQRVALYVAGHDQLWTFGRLASADVWELDSRELPSHVAVASGLVSHWAPEPASPLDEFMQIDSGPLVIDAPASLAIKGKRRALPRK